MVVALLVELLHNGRPCRSDRLLPAMSTLQGFFSRCSREISLLLTIGRKARTEQSWQTGRTIHMSSSSFGRWQGQEERHIANVNQTSLFEVRHEPCHSTCSVPAAIREMRCTSPLSRNGRFRRQVDTIPPRRPHPDQPNILDNLYRAAAGSHWRWPEVGEKQGMLDAGGYSYLGHKREARINTSRANPANQKTKIILTCFCAELWQPFSLLAL